MFFFNLFGTMIFEQPDGSAAHASVEAHRPYKIETVKALRTQPCPLDFGNSRIAQKFIISDRIITMKESKIDRLIKPVPKCHS